MLLCVRGSFGRAMHRRTLLLLGAGTLAGCGYRPALNLTSGGSGVRVVPAPTRVPYPSVVHAVLAAARAELARAGRLAASAYPRVVVEVLRVDELAAGIRAAQVDERRVPRARGSFVAVLGRAWLQEAPGGPAMLDTGDVRRAELVASQGDAVSDGTNFEEAARLAARDLGRALARALLGEPIAAFETP